MKIVYLAAGAANMFCGSCLRDNTLAVAIRELGHDHLLVPTYTPLRTDEENVSEHRIFFGGINVYLQQHSSIFRHTPWFVDRLLDSPRLLKWLSKRDMVVQPEALGDLTVSMILGEHGLQRKELDKLVYWLTHEMKPDIVHLSNAMMIGMAHEIATHTKAPVVCTLSGEDVFLEKLTEPHRTRARDAMRERAAHAQAYVAMNRYYADYMIEYMQLDPARVHINPIGLKLEGHDQRPARSPDPQAPRTIGYLNRICYDKGLHQLVEAFRILCEDTSLPPIKLKVAGYLGASDHDYYEAVKGLVDDYKLHDRYEYVGEVDRHGKIEFLQSLDVMAAPTVYHESKGLSLIEAMANGVPIVVPAHGTFPELIADTAAGVLTEPGNPTSLANALHRLITDPMEAERLGHQGREAVLDRYHADAMAQRTLAIYESLLTAK